MSRIAIVEKQKCNPLGCGGYLCIRVCPINREGSECIKKADDGKAAIDEELCIGCDICVHKCPFDAIHMGRDYEQAQYRRMDLVQFRDEVKMSEKRRPSGYFRPRFEAEMPPQTLLVYGEKKGK